MPEPDGTPTREEHLAAEAEAERRGLVGSSAAFCSRCDLCETNWHLDHLKDADDYAPNGDHLYLKVCPDCEESFAKDDITFNFFANDADETRRPRPDSPKN